MARYALQVGDYLIQMANDTNGVNNVVLRSGIVDIITKDNIRICWTYTIGKDEFLTYPNIPQAQRMLLKFKVQKNREYIRKF